MPKTKSVLEELFGSKIRVKLLNIFYINPTHPYFVRELTRLLKEPINGVRRELEHLEDLGILKSILRQKKKYFQVNTAFALYKELRQLILSAGDSMESIVKRKIRELGRVRLALLTGLFVQDESKVTDVLIVGDIPASKLQKTFAAMEKDLGSSIRYSFFTVEEFEMRERLGDPFLSGIFSSHHIPIVDKRKPVIVKAK